MAENNEVIATMSWIDGYVKGKIDTLRYPDGVSFEVTDISAADNNITGPNIHIVIRSERGRSYCCSSFHAHGNDRIFIHANRHEASYEPNEIGKIKMLVDEFFEEIVDAWNP